MCGSLPGSQTEALGSCYQSSNIFRPAPHTPIRMVHRLSCSAPLASCPLNDPRSVSAPCRLCGVGHLDIFPSPPADRMRSAEGSSAWRPVGNPECPWPLPLLIWAMTCHARVWLVLRRAVGFSAAWLNLSDMIPCWTVLSKCFGCSTELEAGNLPLKELRCWEWSHSEPELFHQ